MERSLVRFDRPAMGGVLSITLPGEPGGAAAAAGPAVESKPFLSAEAAFGEVAGIERAISFFDPASELSHLHRRAASGPVPVDPILFELFEESLRLARRTHGAFDIAVGALMRLWGFRDRRRGADADSARAAPPTSAEIADALDRVGSGQIVLDRAARRVAFRRVGVEVDFGAIGKGFAVDRAVRVLRARGVSSALVSFGSVAFALGAPPGRAAWILAVEDPRQPNAILGTLPLRNRAVSSSGTARQRRWCGRVGISHVIDPRTGRPAGSAAGATVTHPRATEADALSTALLVLGPSEGMRLAAGDPSLEAMIAASGDDGRTGRVATRGWAMVASGRHGMTRRRFVKAAGLVLAALAMTGRPGVASTPERAEEALRLLFPDADSIVSGKKRLNALQMSAAQEAAGKRFRGNTYLFYSVLAGTRPLGHAVILDVRGKERPITFLVAVGPEGAVAGVEVLTYREAIGGEIRSRRFRSQFRGRTLAAPLRLGEDYHGITGATISSRATGYAVRKGLALVAAVHDGAVRGKTGGADLERDGDAGRVAGGGENE